jgi:hypothetical protein
LLISIVVALAAALPVCVRRPSVAQVCLAVTQPSLFIRHSQRIQILRRRSRIVHPFPQ